jgi:hypothetical protein
VLSIEHEDSAYDAELGFSMGIKYLSQFVDQMDERLRASDASRARE